MKLLFAIAFVVLFAGCATAPPSEGERATQSMTDMDGKPIDPGRTGTLGSGGARIGIGIGSWNRSGTGVGIGIGF